MSAIPRNEGEDFADYKLRREADHEATKKALKGKLFHDSYYEGTYTRAADTSRPLKRLSKVALKKQPRTESK